MTIEIPTNLRDFSFLHAWESFKDHRNNIGYPIPDPDEMMNYLSSIGPTAAAAELWDLITFEKSKLKLLKGGNSFGQSAEASPFDFFP